MLVIMQEIGIQLRLLILNGEQRKHLGALCRVKYGHLMSVCALKFL